MDNVGAESSTFTVEGNWDDPVLTVEVDGNGVVLDEDVIVSPGVGLPSLCPPPSKGLYFFFGCLYFSSCISNLTSTSWLRSTFKISIGARP